MKYYSIGIGVRCETIKNIIKVPDIIRDMTGMDTRPSDFIPMLSRGVSGGNGL
jgi:hypothetical protein